ncbi:MAG: ABC transporter ATP-binding protein [Gemmataceae bacterium]
MIVARELTKTYGTGSTAVTALDHVSFSVPAGQRIAILGKSGSGKSTILNLLGGLDHATSGTLNVAGVDLAGMNRAQLAEYRLSKIGFIFQSFHLIPSQSVIQNVEVPLMLAGISPSERRTRASAALEAVGMGHRLTHKPAELSGGERQRTAVARALVNRPSILLADEPTGNLDSTTAKSVMQLVLDQVRERQMMLVLVTHDEELAKRSTERILRMSDGHVISDEAPMLVS